MLQRPSQQKRLSGRLCAEGGEVKRPNLAPPGIEGPGACDVGPGTDRLRQNSTETSTETSTERQELPGRTGLGAPQVINTHTDTCIKEPTGTSFTRKWWSGLTQVPHTPDTLRPRKCLSSSLALCPLNSLKLGVFVNLSPSVQETTVPWRVGGFDWQEPFGKRKD